jgi:hypothetical protein
MSFLILMNITLSLRELVVIDMSVLTLFIITNEQQ